MEDLIYSADDYKNAQDIIGDDIFSEDFLNPSPETDEEEAHKEKISDNTTGKKDEKKEGDKKNEKSPHDGKLFIIQKGVCQCNQGFKFPKFNVTSHKKHYWNDKDGEADYLAVTDADLTFNPIAMPFGNCKLQPTTGGYLPCSYAPVGKWQKPYEKVKVMGNNCLTEISELMCAIGGKITVLKSGQKSEVNSKSIEKAKPQMQHIYNPIINFEEFQDENNFNGDEAW